MAVISGTKKSDMLQGHDGDDTIYGNQGNDVLFGATATGRHNVLVGGTGNDVLTAGNNGDTLFGDGHRVAKVDPANITIAQDVMAHVSFDGSKAGFHNTVGMYVYNDKGLVTDVKVLYANVSAAGVSDGPGALDVPLKAGEHIGFFVAPNAFNHTDHSLFTRTDGKFVMFDATNGDPANVNSGHEMQIAFHSNDDHWFGLFTEYGNATAEHSGMTIYTTNTNDNLDGFQHAHTTVDPVTGKLSIAFEDLQNGGDQNFMDAMFSVDIGKANAKVLAESDHHHVAHHAPNDDILHGGDGNDQLYGMSGNDTLYAGLGDNLVNGGSGDDHIIAGGGHDTIVGGSGFDTLDFGKASQGVKVDLEQHKFGGFGDGTVSGVEGLVGSAYGDYLVGDKADNAMFGGEGNDMLRGGRGSDTLTGGEGNDTFLFLKKDVMDKYGKQQGVDHVTDFAKGDVLDLHDLFQGVKGSHAGLVTVIDTATGSEIYAQLGKETVQVAVLDNVHHMTAADMLKSGMLLA